MKKVCLKQEICQVNQYLYKRIYKRRNVMSTTQLYDQLNELWEQFQENHRKFHDKGNKAAATRARKSIGEIKKLVTDYRKQSVIESKRS